MSTLMKDLQEAHENIMDHYAGKITLRTHHVPSGKPISMPKARVRRIRAAAGMSREVFARCLHASSRTIEKWEQGATRPTGMAAAMLLLLEKRPELVGELAGM